MVRERQNYTLVDASYEAVHHFPLHRRKPADTEEACSLDFWMENYLVHTSLFKPLVYEGPGYFHGWASLYLPTDAPRLFYYDIYQRILEGLMPFAADYLYPSHGYRDDMDPEWENTVQCLTLQTDWQVFNWSSQPKVSA